MTTKTWSFTLDGKSHTLILEHKWLSGKCSIVLDGQLLESVPPRLFASGSVHEYQVDGHSLVVVIQEKAVNFVYDLLIDDVSLETGQRGSQPEKNASLQSVALIGFLMLCLALILGWYAKSNYDRQLVIQEWPVVTGVVTEVGAQYYSDTDNDNLDESYYTPLLTISYTVKDGQYTVNVEGKGHFNTEQEARNAPSLGEEQELYVNSANPQEAYPYFEKLEPGGWKNSITVIIRMFLIVAVVLALYAWVQSRKKGTDSKELQQ